MKIVTASQMRELERIAFDEYGFSSLVMMENAAQGFCDKLEQETGKVCGKKINIFCGRGNNGGDGFAIARLLSVRGAQVTVLIGFDTDRLSGDARVNYELAARFGISISEFSELAGACDIAVDALYGTGFHGEITGAEAEMVRLMNGCGAFVAAVDMPSGASAEDGSVAKICVRADLTVTFGAAKLGQFLYPAKKQAGRVVISEISIPRKVWDEYDSGLFTLDEEIWERIPRREENTHKGSYGKVLLFAGSKGMCGAGVMAAGAVMKSGAGMATLAVPKGIADIAAAKLTEVMTMALPSDGDAVAKSALTMLTEKLQQQEVLLMGCGLGASENVKHLVGQLVIESKKPVVIDADGINALKGNINILNQKKAPVVLTPHPMEFSRITGHSMDYIRHNRVRAARDFAKEYGVTLVLKGADSLVACPDGRVYVNTVSNSGMATAGSGDVLAGIIAGLAAQGASLEDAACVGVHLHTLAGGIAKEKLGEYGMTAVDILNAVPLALMRATETNRE